MKRSESILVYGVTGVLAAILAVAIVFGGDPAETDPLRVAKTDGGEDSTGLVDDVSDEPRDLLDELLGGDLEEADDPVSDPSSSEAGVDSLPPADPAGTSGPIAMPLRTLASLGSHRTEQNPASGERFRFVRVQRGDSLGLIVQRWCPGTDQGIVAALNETVDLRRLRPDQELCLPWIDDEILLQAMESRASRSDARDAAASPHEASVPASTGADEHVLAEGDSLWRVAAKRVGANKADAYIRRILELNPQIQDAGSVRAGQKILLPAN